VDTHFNYGSGGVLGVRSLVLIGALLLIAPYGYAEEKLESAFGFVFGEVYDEDRICDSVPADACKSVRCVAGGQFCKNIFQPIGGHHIFKNYDLNLVNQRLVAVHGKGNLKSHEVCLVWAKRIITSIKSNRDVSLVPAGEVVSESERKNKWFWMTGEQGDPPDYSYRSIALLCNTVDKKTEISLHYFSDVGLSTGDSNL